MDSQNHFNLPKGTNINPKNGQTKIDVDYYTKLNQDLGKPTEPLDLKKLIAEKGVKPDADGFYKLEEIFANNLPEPKPELEPELEPELDQNIENIPNEQSYITNQGTGTFPIPDLKRKKAKKAKKVSHIKKDGDDGDENGGYRYRWQEIYNK